MYLRGKERESWGLEALRREFLAHGRRFEYKGDFKIWVLPRVYNMILFASSIKIGRLSNKHFHSRCVGQRFSILYSHYS